MPDSRRGKRWREYLQSIPAISHTRHYSRSGPVNTRSSEVAATEEPQPDEETEREVKKCNQGQGSWHAAMLSKLRKDHFKAKRILRKRRVTTASRRV